MKIKKSFLKASYLALILMLIFSLFSVSVNAENISNMPYTSYTYWDGYANKTPVPVKSTYEPNSIITARSLGIESFSEINQIVSDGNYLYIVDSGNDRIVKLDSNNKLVEIITSFRSGSETVTFSNPKGIYVYEDEIYVADTDNQRILCAKNGDIFKIITEPESTTIPEDYIYSPIRVIKDKNGYLYVLCDGSYYGIMVFANDYEFRGFYGANEVKKSVFGAFKELIASFFETEQKHAASVQELPYQTADMCLDAEGFICTVNSEAEGQIKRLGSKGSNVLIYKDQFVGTKADSYNFGDFPVSYVDTTTKYSTLIEQKFNAITTDSDGYIYAMDSTQGRIYMYDNKCNLLTVFGGGVSAGTQVGTFVTPNSIAVFGEKLYVSDFNTGEITTFNLTEYGRNLKLANKLTNNGDYIKAKEYWTLINKQDKNCQLAYKGLAKAALEEENYNEAMKYAKIGLDRVTYAAAFKYVRNEFISDYFLVIALLVIVIFGAITAFLIISKKRKIIFVKNEYLRTAVNTPIHPFNSFYDIKFKNMGSALIATCTLILYYISTISITLNGGFMYVIADLTSFNSLFIIIGTIGVVLLWVIMNWAVSMLSDGKGTFKEVYCSTCYCLIPQIVYNLLFIILSHTVIATNNSGFGTISLIFNLLTIILILISITVIQDFSFFKAMAISVVSVIMMGIGAFVIFIILTLGQDFVAFILGIINEILLR